MPCDGCWINVMFAKWPQKCLSNEKGNSVELMIIIRHLHETKSQKKKTRKTKVNSKQ